jgi:hypothetical protein
MRIILNKRGGMDDDFLEDIPVSDSASTRHALLTAALLHLMSQYTMRSPAALDGSRSAQDEGERPASSWPP